MSLPKFVGIQSKANDKYLWCDRVDTARWIKGAIFSDGKEILSPYAKFAVEPSSTSLRLVHIRCCYNNKYLVSSANTPSLIVADAKEKEEDRSKGSCTLFEPIVVDSTNRIFRLRHVKSNSNIRVISSTGLLATTASRDPLYDDDSFIVTDWESLVLLPERVAFKGNDGKYLGTYKEAPQTVPYVTFLQGDKSNAKFWHKVVTLKDGSISISSNDTKKYWNIPHYSWIQSKLDESSTKNADNTWFWPINIDNDKIAIRHVIKDELCSRDSSYAGWPDGFAAKSSLLTEHAFVSVEEPVLKRLINKVNFPLSDPSIYNKRPIKVTVAQAANGTNESQTISIELHYTETKSITWARTTFNAGVNTRIQAVVPKFSEGGGLSFEEFSGEIQWGKTQTSTTESRKVYKVALKPRTKFTVNLFATEGSCDNPFSYTQRDILTDGSVETIEKNDGLYTVTNLFDFTFETKEEPLQYARNIA